MTSTQRVRTSYDLDPITDYHNFVSSNHSSRPTGQSRLPSETMSLQEFLRWDMEHEELPRLVSTWSIDEETAFQCMKY